MAERYSNTADKGIGAAMRIFNDELGWIFREQPKHDMGIDAQIEIVDNGTPTGILIGAQIKTGASHFTEHDDHLVFYGEMAHAQYWLKHSLPVILIAHLPVGKKTYWQVVNKETIVYTAKAWKIHIPKANTLDEDSAIQLYEVASKGPGTRKMEKLLFDWELIKHIEEGGKVVVYTEEWFHKSLGRGPFKIILVNQSGREEIVKEWKQFYASSLTGILEHHFPWADFEVDEDYYELHGDYTSLEEAQFRPTPNPYELYPYTDWQGEAGPYRIMLSLNELGKAFVRVMEFVEEPD